LDRRVTVADATGDMEPAVEDRSALAQAHLQSSDPDSALTTAAAALEFTYPL
jgi:hypothetical protein